MLSRRLISAVVIISLILLLLRLDFWLGQSTVYARPGLVLALLAMLVAAMASLEMVSMWAGQTQQPDVNLVLVATEIMVFVDCIPVLFGSEFVGQSFTIERLCSPFFCAAAGSSLAFGLTVIVEMLRFDATHTTAGTITDRIGRAALIYLYLNLLFGFLIPHRFLDGNNGLGIVALVALISTVKLADSFAYFAGKSLGTIKLAAHLSPQKTVQGAIGGVMGGCVASAIVIFGVAPLICGPIGKPWWWFLIYGLLVTLAGMVGDLAESLFKRDAACKDSSRLLPGLGGILDVLDSLIMAAPVSYFLWII